jgi:2-polyprenyl-3-methyl-5-hydroxy-6-metoxy-1,4-benzoquinol methylase
MTQSRYDKIAEWYDESVRKGWLTHDIVLPDLFALIGDVGGKRICDLACGQGIIARQMARQGAFVVGVDISTKLLEVAKREEDVEPLGITYLQDDAQSLTGLEDDRFDGVVCNLALMDILDLSATFRTVQRILRPHGWFVFSITHPCLHPPASRWVSDIDGTVKREVAGYFAEIFWRSDNPNGVRGQVGAYHRTLSTYLNSLVEARLTLERFVEPQATGIIAERFPGYREIPAVLLVRGRK